MPLLRAHAAMQRYDVLGEPRQAIGKVGKMLLSFRDQQRRTPGIERGQDIVEDQIVAPFIARKLAIDLLNRRLVCLVSDSSPKSRLVKDDLVAEWPGRRLFL